MAKVAYITFDDDGRVHAVSRIDAANDIEAWWDWYYSDRGSDGAGWPAIFLAEDGRRPRRGQRIQSTGESRAVSGVPFEVVRRAAR